MGKFVRREVAILRVEARKIVNDYRIVIGIMEDDTGIVYPHPITGFIDREYYTQSKSIHNELGPADVIVSFLNHLLTEYNSSNSEFINLRGIYDLEVKHAEHYLSYCGEVGNSISTVERKERYLTHFYDYLWNQQWLRNDPKIKIIFVTNRKDDRSKAGKQLISPFIYKKPKSKFDNNRIKKKDMLTQSFTDPNLKQIQRINYIREFLITASILCPDIALAIAFQFYGGLRAGECMNLDTGAIKPQNGSKYGEKGMILEVRDRQFLLFPNRKNKYVNEVKKERDQSLLIDPLLPYLYEKHQRWLKKKKSTVPKALFINDRGEALDVPSYRRRFNTLKEFYLGVLSGTIGRYQDYREFRETRWSTHIGRGAFTNLCLDGGFNAVQTAILRGDSSPQSMYDYTDILTATWNISRAIELLSPVHTEKIPSFETSEINKYWKDVLNFGKSR